MENNCCSRCLPRGKEGDGRRLVDAVLDTKTAITIPAMIALAIGDDTAAELARDFAKRSLIEPVAKWLGNPHGRARAHAMLIVSTGFVIYNRHIIIDENHPSRAKVGNWLANTIQEIVDGSDHNLKLFLRTRPIQR
ncbi:hypothetical protein [Halioxenophilus sp. WMMB6]|uniref:TetR/AcrR family transcriptional regulator n=1 Tax=Halioxenophilus sp. WMMB6 TaxID=3073815 RepID=UPI00295E4E4A|nr:hypothetical protein [Halioxenophilus sp. WMMB6]